jgi:hypothetical protein
MSERKLGTHTKVTSHEVQITRKDLLRLVGAPDGASVAMFDHRSGGAVERAFGEADYLLVKWSER